MQTTLTIRDETLFGLGGKLTFIVALPIQRITVRDLIHARVQQEVQAYNSQQPEYYHGLVQPSDAEATLNGYRIRHRRLIDAEAQCERAIEAFQRNGFIILVDGRQVSSLDEVIEVGPETAVTFLKLVPLVGG
jgi:hypothetical protein